MAESAPRGGSRATDHALQIAAIDLFVVPNDILQASLRSGDSSSRSKTGDDVSPTR